MQIYLLARPSFDVNAFMGFLTPETGDWRRSKGATEGEEIVEIAGRVCYMSFGKRQSSKTNAEYLDNLITSGHESVLEHVNWTFLIEGVSRAFTHQLVRHRPGWAYSQLSQQYVDEADARFVEPEEIREDPELSREWHEAVAATRDAYVRLREMLSQSAQRRDKEQLRRVRSAARSVLPNATETKIVVTANARALRHFFRVRGAIEGDSEMRRVCAQLLTLVQREAPNLFSDFSIRPLGDGTPMVIQDRVAAIVS
jgi:thymidylate synthase (FAD)